MLQPLHEVSNHIVPDYLLLDFKVGTIKGCLVHWKVAVRKHSGLSRSVAVYNKPFQSHKTQVN